MRKTGTTFAFFKATSSRINTPKPNFARIAANYSKARPAPAIPVAIPADAQVKPTMPEIINSSVNQTLARTIMTSVTTIVASLALFILGGSVIHDFALTISLGVVFGTWSSIFIASPILMAFGSVDLYHSKAQVQNDYERPGEHGIV